MTARKILSACFISLIFVFSQFAPILADVTSGSTTTLSVPPKGSNFQLSITADKGPGPISQGTDITYTITYGASPSAAFTTDNILVVNFSKDTFDGVTNVADYMIGSATAGYNNAPPIVDLINRTITWNISQLPSGTVDQIVSFKMRTNSNYTGQDYIPIITTASLTNQYATLNDSLTITYGFHISPPGPPTPTPTPTPIPTPQLTAVNFSQITATSVTISTVTSVKTRLNAFYGESPTNMSQQAQNNTLATDHVLKIENLTPGTTYYIQLISTDMYNQHIRSEIFRFETAKKSIPLTVDQSSVILVSGNIPLINTNLSLPFAQVFLPAGKPYTIGLRIPPPKNVKNIVTLIQDSHVLGSNTFSSDQNYIWSAPMIEQQPGVYIAQLTSPTTPKMYDVLTQISDTNGNITLTKIAETIVYGSLQVINKSSHQPIEHARILLSLYDISKKSYVQLFSTELQQNPMFTDKNGLAVITNGSGKYKIDVSQYDYRTQTITFTIDKNHLYPPVVKLEYIGFSIPGAIEYYINTITDFGQQLFANVQNLTGTTRYFKLTSAIVILCLIIVTFLLFLVRTRLSLIVIPLFIKHHVQKTNFVHGQILDGITHQPIAQAIVAISNISSHEILSTTSSNKNGVFYLKSSSISPNNMLNILAPGYRTNKFVAEEAIFPATIYLHHNLVGGPIHNPLIQTILDFAGLFFDSLLVLSFILEIFFIQALGISGIVFLCISLFNLFLWVLYQREKRL